MTHTITINGVPSEFSSCELVRQREGILRDVETQLAEIYRTLDSLNMAFAIVCDDTKHETFADCRERIHEIRDCIVDARIGCYRKIGNPN